MRSEASFWNRIANMYSKKPVPDEEIYQRKLKETREFFRPDSEIFEFGCGTGTTALHHAPYVKHICATDFSESMIKIAKKKAEAQKIDNVSFECASFQSLDLSPESYDVVLGLSILHLLPDIGQVMTKVHTILKPGGVFVTSTACIADFSKLLKYVAPIGKRLGFLPLLNVFSKQELVQSFLGTGFVIEREWQPGPSKSTGVFIIAKK